MHAPTFGALALVVALISTPLVAQAHAQTPPQANRLRVFLECGDCFETYLRDEIEWLDFVRDPAGADVHVIGTSNTTGGGGREVLLRFVGLGRFQGMDTELKALSQSGDTDDMRRQTIRRVLTVGLLGYLERAGQGGDVRIQVDPAVAGTGQTRTADDPWNAWTLEWATRSPPPSYNFETIPTVRSRRPLWDVKHPDDPDWKYE